MQTIPEKFAALPRRNPSGRRPKATQTTHFDLLHFDLNGNEQRKASGNRRITSKSANHLEIPGFQLPGRGEHRTRQRSSRR